jgi:nucleotide-binding universal stress UspA family protein
MLTLRTIVHPTDFSATSMEAFFHALRIAVTMKSELCILHVSAALGTIATGRRFRLCPARSPIGV